MSDHYRWREEKIALLGKENEHQEQWSWHEWFGKRATEKSVLPLHTHKEKEEKNKIPPIEPKVVDDEGAAAAQSHLVFFSLPLRSSSNARDKIAPLLLPIPPTSKKSLCVRTGIYYSPFVVRRWTQGKRTVEGATIQSSTR